MIEAVCADRDRRALFDSSVRDRSRLELLGATGTRFLYALLAGVCATMALL